MDRYRFEHDADDVQPAVRRQRGHESVPVERDVHGDQQHVERPGQLLDRVRIAAGHDVSAPNRRASSNLLSLEVNAVTSQP